MREDQLDALLDSARPSVRVEQPDVAARTHELYSRIVLSRARRRRFRLPAVLGLVVLVGAAGGTAAAVTNSFPWQSDRTVEATYAIDGSPQECVFELAVDPDRSNVGFDEAKYQAAEGYLAQVDWAHLAPDLSVLGDGYVDDARKHGIPEYVLVTSAVQAQFVDEIKARGWSESVVFRSFTNCSESTPK